MKGLRRLRVSWCRVWPLGSAEHLGCSGVFTYVARDIEYIIFILVARLVLILLSRSTVDDMNPALPIIWNTP